MLIVCYSFGLCSFSLMMEQDSKVLYKLESNSTQKKAIVHGRTKEYTGFIINEINAECN